MKRADLYLAAVLLLAAAVMAVVIHATRKTGSTVTVTVDGAIVASYPLDDDRTEVISGVDGGTNTLVISQGRASIEEADCPDKLCVHKGAIRYEGETIVCLPHRVVIGIQGGAENGIDGIVR